MELGMKKKLAVLVIASLLIVVAIGVLLVQDDHDHQLDINGNDELISAAEHYDWPGDGSPEDPFIIDSVKFNVSGDAPCIAFSNTSLHIEMINCVLSHHMTEQGTMQGIGVLLDNVTNVVLSNNVVKTGQTGLKMISSFGNIVLNNSFSGMGPNLISSSNENRFEGNVFSVIDGTGLIVQNSDSNRFRFNVIQGMILGAGGTRGSIGLVLTGSMDNWFFTDQMSGDGYMSIGISLIDSSENMIDRAEVNGRTAIYMARASDNELLYNVFGNAAVTAIEMLDSDRNTMIGNVLESNFSVCGIRCITSDENQFTWNDLGVHSSVGYAFYTTGSQGNQMVNNTFRYSGAELRTQKLALDDNGLNLWNDTSVGNHWSDWTSPDLDTDGIVDDPYVMDGGAGAADRLPLVVPAAIP